MSNVPNSEPSKLGPKLHVHEFCLCAGEFALGPAHAVHGLRAVPEFPGDRDLVAVAIVWQLLIRCSGWQPRLLDDKYQCRSQ